MTNIRSQLVRWMSVVLAFAASATLSQAQTNAACTFSFFQVKGTISNPQGNHAFGVNSFATVVGEGETSMNVEKGFVRYSGGGTNFFSNLTFAARNDKGVSVGTYVPSGSSTAEGFMLNGSTLTAIRTPNRMGSMVPTRPESINGTASSVGMVIPAVRFMASNDLATEAMRRWIFPARRRRCPLESTTMEQS